MNLNSLNFAAFFLIFLAVLLILPKKLRKGWLFAGNCLFYLSWERGYAALLLASALMVWLCGIVISDKRYQNSGFRFQKNLLLILPVVWNVGLLILFRYTWLISNIFRKSGTVLTIDNLLPPLGISFYTLRCISYISEIYRGNLQSVKNPFDVIIYVS